MGENSAIEWTDHTFNPWIGCTRVSPGCANCYAATKMQDRLKVAKWGDEHPRHRTKTWDAPIRWNRWAAIAGKPAKVFCASLADVFDAQVVTEWREDLWRLIELTPHLTWQLLTKRIHNVADMVPWARNVPWPSNVWIGTSIENQECCDIRMPILEALPAAVRFVSAEPLLGDVQIGDADIDWLICGGESGPNYRPVDPDHVRSLRDQCLARGIPFFFKQWGGGKAAANGKTLDGQEYLQFPKSQIRFA